MKTIYVKDPGFVYDLIYIICITLNRDNFYSELKRKKINSEDDISFYENIMNLCGKLPEDILPFFYVEKNNPSFIAIYYLMNKKNPDKFTIQNLLTDLSDIELLKQNLTEYYFGLINRNNNDYIDLIDKSNLNLSLKYRLTRIYIDITRASKLVIEVIQQLVPVLENIYLGFNDIINEKIEMLSDVNRIEALYSLEKLEKDKDIQTIFSICIINRYISISAIDEYVLFILGDDYIDNIEINKEVKNIKVDLIAVGKIISDPTRLKMFELLKERKEIYTGEMCDILDMTLTAVFYHLNLMLNEKMLKTRNEGRKVFYSINNEYFDILSEAVLTLKVN